jgi:hypothetical protein
VYDGAVFIFHQIKARAANGTRREKQGIRGDKSRELKLESRIVKRKSRYGNQKVCFTGNKFVGIEANF